MPDNDYLAILSRVPPRVWIMPCELSLDFCRASLEAHLYADYSIACWEWDDIWCGQPLN